MANYKIGCQTCSWEMLGADWQGTPELILDAVAAVGGEDHVRWGAVAPGEGLQLFGFRAEHSVSGNMAGWAAGGHYQRGYWGELNSFARACLGLTAPSPALEDGVKAIRLIEAMLESAATGKEVAV